MAAFDNLKVAIAHYWCIRERGGEKVLKNLLELFPQADVYTLFYDPEGMGHVLKGHRVFTSKLDHPLLRQHYTKCFPLFPYGVRSLKLQDDYDLLISSESGPIKGIAKPHKIPHLCYTHTPMRYCWGHTEEYLRDLPSLLKPLAKKAFESLKTYDRGTIDNVDQYLANSDHVKKRIQAYYNKEANVIHPPIADHLFDVPLQETSAKKHYLSFGALVPYKRIDLLVDTFKDRSEKLVVIGEGSERAKLTERASDNVEFTGPLPWDQVQTLLQEAKALLFPGEEDFGLIPLEAMALGCPVLAYGCGGALETVVESEQRQQSSGMFFLEQSSEAISDVIERFEEVQNQFSPAWMREHAQNFSQSHFKEKILDEVSKLLKNK